MSLKKVFTLNEGEWKPPGGWRGSSDLSMLLDKLASWNGVSVSNPRDNTMLLHIPAGEAGLPDVTIQFDLNPEDGFIESVRLPGATPRQGGF